MELTTTEFVTTLLSVMSLYNQTDFTDFKPKDTPQINVLKEYDFIIVGAGSAGCVVANRLSEMKQWNILLIEAGGDEDELNNVPLLHFFQRNNINDWNYTTVRQVKACLDTDGLCAYPRGHMMGGSSSINAMMYVRGNKQDFDEWDKKAKGWAYKDVLQYFIKAENITEPSLKNSQYHGNQGYLDVSYAKYTSPLRETFLMAGRDMGLENVDFNGEQQEGIGTVQYTMAGSTRESASKAYLNSIRHRKNLHIIKNSVVSKTIIKNKVTIGVEYYSKGQKYTVFARNEVILSTGAVNTPKILMLSGIGPRDELKRHNIDVIADLPVGKGLQDHLQLPMFFEIDTNETLTPDIWKTKESINRYVLNNDGPLTTPGAEVMAFMNIFNKTQAPNLQVIWFCLAQNDKNRHRQLVTVVLSNIDSKSEGRIKLKSNYWEDPPIIDPNYFNKKIDFKVFQKGFEFVMRYMKTPTMSQYSPKLSHKNYPACEGLNYYKKYYIKCIIQNYSRTIFHPVSTARMGTVQSKDTVVTADLLVKSVKKLRIIDASVMPRITRGNTNAPTIMIAEKASDMIKASYSHNSIS